VTHDNPERVHSAAATYTAADACERRCYVGTDVGGRCVLTDLAEQARRLAATESPRVELEPGGALIVAVVGDDEDVIAAVEGAFAELREASSQTGLRTRGIAHGYRLEDVVALAVRVPSSADAEDVRRWLARRVPGASLDIDVGGRVTLGAAFAPRMGRAPSRARYARESDGRLRVEAFELHVVEHCNLRCANCCNMSPLVAERTMSVAETEAMCRRMAEVLVTDVFKIMGGEPLMHPDITGVIHAIRRVGISDRVRLFTNGLLLPAMKQPFWEALDELTISNYSSAPVKPAILELSKRRAREFGFVLNIKNVSEFSQVLSPRYQSDDGRVQDTFARCWLRHRCLIVRDRRFYMCTRAAYAEDFLARSAHEPLPAGVVLDRSEDGVHIDAPDLPERLEAYMNRERPLGACRYCFGGDGATEPHVQLSRREVAEGVLSRALTESRWLRK
jgi:hypothetical protein